MKRTIVIASVALLVFCAVAAQAFAGPVLAGPWSTGQKGYGHARPKTIFNGGDPSGLVNHIRWASWGGPHAVGFGIGLYVGPHQATLDGWNEGAEQDRPLQPRLLPRPAELQGHNVVLPPAPPSLVRPGDLHQRLHGGRLHSQRTELP